MDAFVVSHGWMSLPLPAGFWIPAGRNPRRVVVVARGLPRRQGLAGGTTGRGGNEPHSARRGHF